MAWETKENIQINVLDGFIELQDPKNIDLKEYFKKVLDANVDFEPCN